MRNLWFEDRGLVGVCVGEFVAKWLVLEIRAYAGEKSRTLTYNYKPKNTFLTLIRYNYRRV